MQLDQLAVSPCSNPAMGIDDVLAAYSRLGYRHFEVFTSWARSAFDYRADPRLYLAKGSAHGMDFCSLHLPPVAADADGHSLDAALDAARFAAAIGSPIVLFKAKDRTAYVKSAPAFLDAVEALGLTPVVQNHRGTALTTLEDVTSLIEEVSDPRLRVLLEVGHFHSAGVGWRRAADTLGDLVALVHIKDQTGRQSVPFGQGEIDLHGLFRHMDGRGYAGRYVVEMEVRDQENTLAYLADAYKYVRQYCEEDK